MSDPSVEEINIFKINLNMSNLSMVRIDSFQKRQQFCYCLVSGNCQPTKIDILQSPCSLKFGDG